MADVFATTSKDANSSGLSGFVFVAIPESSLVLTFPHDQFCSDRKIKAASFGDNRWRGAPNWSP
jgi:hypothetical protein